MTADRGRAALVAVCVLHALSPLLLIGVHFWYGWDETVYVSQISTHVPPGYFSAPRARGMPLVVAPVSVFTTSIVAIRVYLSVLSGIGLYIGFWPWLRLRPGYPIPLAALLFSSLWISIFYGFEAMPNQYVAFGALAATGYLLLAQRDPDRGRRYALYVALAIAFTGLVRPTDSLFVAAPLLVAAVLGKQSWPRRRLLIVAIGVGLVIGCGEWLIEAAAYFGGPAARIHSASAENTGGLHFALGAQLRTLAGSRLCRAGCTASSPTIDRLWFYLLVPLTALGVAVGRRRGETRIQVAAVAVALSVAAEYLFLISYAAPRFLLPTYALLAIPTAEALVWLVGRTAAARRPLVVVTLVALFVGHLAIQVDVLHASVVPSATRSNLRDLAIARSLKTQGIRPRCLVLGNDNAQIGYAVGCHDSPADPDHLFAPRAGQPGAFAVVSFGAPPPGATTATEVLRPIRAPGVPTGWRAYIKLPTDDSR